MTEYTNIKELKGIGEKTEKLFCKMGITTAGELIRHYPRGYDIYDEPVPVSMAEEGTVVSITGMLYGRVQVTGTRAMQVTTAHIKDITGTLRVIWFRMPFLKNSLSKGGTITLRGRIVNRKGALVMEHPELFYPANKYDEKLNTMQPVYTLTAGLSNNLVMKAVKQALEEIELSKDTLPQELRLRYALAEYNYALRGIHFPTDKEVFYHARERLVFEEFLKFIVSVRLLRKQNEKVKNDYPITMHREMQQFVTALPFALTNAQNQVYREILSDMEGDTVMSRLVQGDVGSGKTIVAVLALMNTVLSGYQGALMAPTEVLARQHYEGITKLFAQYGVRIHTELLTGSMTAKEKRACYKRIEQKEADIIIGTHALIQEKVQYYNLGLVVTDEQHRFGVKQREAFARKGGVPHILVMSATPIPRTLAIIIYGDLEVSVIDELPSNRLPIKNCVVDTGYRNTAYTFMKNQVQDGRQCYVICPMVEESEHLEVENVTDYAQSLKETLGEEICTSYLHGKMKQTEKDNIMAAFAKNEIQVLVSTTVIEVGIDVPNATVMLIENAERFGLAQLHQLRGRVGRGKYQSYCIFMTASKSKETKDRLAILNKSNDGFKIASEDLRLRGPGDLFGIRQSGILDFKLGDIYQDARLLQMANEAADELLNTAHDWLKNLPNYVECSSVII